MKMPGLLSAILLPALLCAQKPVVKSSLFAQIDARALQLPDSSGHDVSRIAAYINANFVSPTENIILSTKNMPRMRSWKP
jgi:hypothetical protein